MILYFDTFITEEPLFVRPKLAAFENKIRNGCYTYRQQGKLDIVKYTLSSYATVKWSNVLIKYELSNTSLNNSFDEFILELFPNATIIHNRSANQKEYRRSLEILDNFDDEWVFYSPNNDHPVIATSVDIFDDLIRMGNNFKKDHKNFISIYYSHFSETINAAYPGTIYHARHWSDAKIVEENETSVSVLRTKGDLSGAMIVHKALLGHWFCSKDLGDARIIRSEDLGRYIIPPPQVVIVPKKEICRHYDGYYHTLFQPRTGIAYVLPEQVPPLFIPNGFFEKKIRIAYGYDEYRDGWVNINPLKEQYSFRDNKNGTDLMCTLDDVPLFWKDRIAEVDVNLGIAHGLMKVSRDRKYEIIRNPWKDLPRHKVFFYIVWVKLSRNLWPLIDRIKANSKSFLKSNSFFYATAKRLLNKDF
jgi:hypothetical protein